jgi:hypothetical protein
MGKVIYKYPFKHRWGLDTIDLPLDCDILCVQEQHGDPVLYVEHSNDLDNIQGHRFVTVGTGESMDFDGKYIGTFQLSGGNLVFHTYFIGID